MGKCPGPNYPSTKTRIKSGPNHNGPKGGKGGKK